MARDYAHKSPPPETSSRLPAWIWLFTLVIAAGFIGFLYYLSQLPAGDEGAEALRQEVLNLGAQSEPGNKPRVETTEPLATQKQLEQAFQFYQLLKNDEVPVTLSPAEQAKPDAAQAASKSWMIQVASFNRLNDAERMRAELILSGLTEAHVENINLGDRGNYHRVMVGPFDDRSQLNRAQDILAELNQEVIVRTLN